MMLRDLMLGTDKEAMRDYCIDRFGIDIKPFRVSFVGMKQGKSFPYDGDEPNAAWIKNRLAELECFPHGCDAGEINPPSMNMHVFFLCLEETDEMVSRLKNERIIANGTVARSKVGKTSRVIRPIDKTAQAVSGFTDANQSA